MLKFDHLALPVADWQASRDWYVATLGMSVEFEIPDRLTAAVRDQFDFTIFLVQAQTAPGGGGIALWFQVDDVDATHAALSRRGVAFNHAPAKMFWGLRRRTVRSGRLPDPPVGRDDDEGARMTGGRRP